MAARIIPLNHLPLVADEIGLLFYLGKNINFDLKVRRVLKYFCRNFNALCLVEIVAGMTWTLNIFLQPNGLSCDL